MCLMTYIATDVLLESDEWQEGKGVTICPLPAVLEDIKTQFSLPHVYMIASSEGCGCGFLTFEDQVRAMKERADLGKILDAAVGGRTTLELLICFAGYERKPITQRLQSCTSQLSSVPFDNGWYYEVILVDVVSANLV